MRVAASQQTDARQRGNVARELGAKFAERLTPAETRRGRGAPSNATGRFEIQRRDAFDDGWEPDEVEPLRTEVAFERPRAIITRNESPDISFDRSINPYRGCEHGCAYCYARPTHAYLGLSAGLDFETKLFVKENAAALLEKELAAPKYRPAVIALGANTDPYQPIERQYRVTRSVLEVLARANHPVGIVTKSNLVVRDLDLLAPMAAEGAGEGLCLGDDAGARPRPPHGAARADARAPARGDRAPGGGRRAGRRAGRADRAGDQRRRDREDPDPRLRGGGARGRLCDAAAAAGAARVVPRMAGGPFPRPSSSIRCR